MNSGEHNECIEGNTIHQKYNNSMANQKRARPKTERVVSNSCLLQQRRTVRILSFLCFPVCSSDGFYVSPNVRDYCRQRDTVGAHMAKSVSEEPTSTTMATALCIIPPDETWDTIQRARHMARDRTYQKWPPAIRLFHPFCAQDLLSDRALDIAHIVEEYNIEPFQVTLGSWTIVPHMEAIEADWEAMKQLPAQEKVIKEEMEEETKADRLIAEEERLGRERLLHRAKRSRQKRQAAGKPVTETASEIIAREEDEAKSRKQASNDLLEKQKQQYEEFNGPCVLCLEPDEESRERITQIRELLRTELFEEFTKFSPSSSVSTSRTLPRAVLEADETTSFRPIVPVGNFPTVTSAVEMARKLKGLWDPLCFNVTDFQLISYEDEALPSENHADEFSDNAEYNLKQITSWRHVDVEEEVLTSQGQYGCDAQVMLMGEEIDTDEESSKEMVDFIMNQGSPGGFELKEGGSIDNEPQFSSVLEESNQETNDATEDLELWLDCDDEWDEGTVIVIGRTHFFTGDMRNYDGMPATNTMDAKDRIFGEGTNALARRKGSG